jgi:hypothetical protein
MQVKHGKARTAHHISPPPTEVKNSYSQLINDFPEDVTYFHDDHYLGSTIGAGFQVNRVNARLHVVDILPRETAKPLRGRHVYLATHRSLR